MIFISSFFFFWAFKKFQFSTHLECVRFQIQFFSYANLNELVYLLKKKKLNFILVTLVFVNFFLSLLINDSFSSKQFILMTISISLADKNTEIVKLDIMIVV